MTVQEIASLWLAAGGNPRALGEAVSVALAESGGTPAALTPGGGRGLFGIRPVKDSRWASPDIDLVDPAINAAAAVELSADGLDWSRFPSAWADGVIPRNAKPLSAPQRGSAAERESWIVTAQIGPQALPVTGAAMVSRNLTGETQPLPPGNAGRGAGITPDDSRANTEAAVRGSYSILQVMIGQELPTRAIIASNIADAIGRI